MGKRSGESVVKVRITSKATNAILARYAEKYGSHKAAAAELGVCAATFSAWLNFHYSPLTLRDGQWVLKRPEKMRKIMLKLAEETGERIEDIFGLTKEQMQALSPPRVAERELSQEDLISYAHHEADRLTYDHTRDAELRELAADVPALLKTLSDREREIIKMRYGIPDGRPETLSEVAKVFGVNKERIRQIEAKAILKLKQPHRAGKLAGHLD